jgi:hypothetical protein
MELEAGQLERCLAKDQQLGVNETEVATNRDSRPITYMVSYARHPHLRTR